MRQPTPSPYTQLLTALGDSNEARLLINNFAHSLALTAREAEETQWPGRISDLIDPFQHTRETWSAVTRCLAITQPLTDGTSEPTTPRSEATIIRESAEWLRTEYPGPDLDQHIRRAADALNRHAETKG